MNNGWLVIPEYKDLPVDEPKPLLEDFFKKSVTPFIGMIAYVINDGFYLYDEKLKWCKLQ